MSLALMIALIVLGVGLAAYIASSPDVPYWLKMMLNVVLALILVVAIVSAIFVIVAVVAHI